MARTVNKKRVESMLCAYETACADMPRPIDAEQTKELEAEGGYDPEGDPKGVPIERQIKVMLAVNRCLPRFTKVDAGRLVVPDVEAFLDAVATELSENDDLFLPDLAAIRALLARLELRILPTGKRRDSTMQTYEFATVLFNEQLARDQARGTRLKEKPVKKSAIIMAVSRHKNSVK